MNKMRFVHLTILLAFMLAISLQPANGQTTGPVSASAESQPAFENSSDAPGDGEITPLTISLGGGPDYDSGWEAIQQGATLTFRHNLGGSNTNNYWVDLEYWNEDNGINKNSYGGADVSSTNELVGVYWRNLDTTNIKVTRRLNDPYADKVRVRIWNQTPPVYNSEWNPLGQVATWTEIHDLGGSVENYLVDLQFLDPNPGGYGINQRFFGGSDCLISWTDCIGNKQEGGSWYELDTHLVTVFRQQNDTSFGYYRVRIWIMPKVPYDSGWHPIEKDSTLTLTHSVGGNANDYVVDLEFKSTTATQIKGINQIYFGGASLGSGSRPAPLPCGNPGDQVGAFWENLTNTSIDVHRNANDCYADEVRVRIWNFWRPTPADYDSDWFSTPVGPSTKTFNLSAKGGNSGNYLVDFQFKDSAGAINQHHYGTNEFGTNPDPGKLPEQQVGAYWDDLTDNSIQIVRAADDSSVAQSRVRIWVMPKPDFDTDWQPIEKNQTMRYNHDLGGSVENYLVDLQFERQISETEYLINQAAYGGFDTGTHSSLGADQRVGVFWSRLNAATIDLVRRAEDVFADKVRLRIWRMAKPNYNSGFRPTEANGIPTLYLHGLNQDPENYFITTTFNNGALADGYNQAFYGGADLGNKEAGKENDKVGAYWSGLTSSRIWVTKEIDDPYAGQAAIRIWVTKFETFLPVTKKP